MKLLPSLLAAWLSLAGSAQAGPRKIQGVNLGNWLIFESWMAPDRWSNMGGDSCDDCTTCAATEYTLTKKLGQSQANKVFQDHWSTWFTQSDVDEIVCLGLNTVRIPVGWWIIEELKDSNDYFPTGQMAHLKRGLKMLKDAGIHVMLDLHANPGVQSVQQQFTGWCRNTVDFYDDYNYGRSLKASAVLASLIHADPDFSTVFAFQAVNEPEVNPDSTPGLLDYYKSFVETVRSVEQWQGMRCPTTEKTGRLGQDLDSATKTLIKKYWKKLGLNPKTYDRVTSVSNSVKQPGLNNCIWTTFMSAAWQYYDAQRYKPAEAAMGMSLYDHHLYLSFGGIADADPTSYLRHICGLQDFRQAGWWYGEQQQLAFLGEWWLATQWTATGQTPDLEFYKKFGDAQKMMYGGQSRGWIFWSWKVENTGEFGYTRDYRQAVAKGIMTRDPDEYFDSNVCQESWDYFSNYGKRDQIPDMPSMDGDSRIEFPMVGLPHLDSTGAIPVAGDTLLDFDQ